MIIDLCLVNNNSPFGSECSGWTKKIMQWCVLNVISYTNIHSIEIVLSNLQDIPERASRYLG